MTELLTQFSISEVVMVIVTLSLSIKGCVSFFDWAKKRLKEFYDKDYQALEEKREIEESIDDLNKFYSEKKRVDDTFEQINQTFVSVNKCIDMLIESDKESIKSFIVDKHHFFVYEQEWIDDYSLECLEKRFAIYRREHGNSFVEGLMDEIRDLPKCPPKNIEHKYLDTQKYVERTGVDKNV